MKIVCPYCQEKMNLEDYLKDKTLLHAFKLLPDFAGYSGLAFEYAELFRIGPPFNARKLLRVLTELREIDRNQGFDFQKRRYQISRAGLIDAVKTVCNSGIKGPLKNHNYLKKVAIGIAEEEEKRRIADGERHLRKREEALRQGDRDLRPDLEEDPGGGKKGFWNPGQAIKSLLQNLDRPQGPTAEGNPRTDAVSKDAGAVD